MWCALAPPPKFGSRYRKKRSSKFVASHITEVRNEKVKNVEKQRERFTQKRERESRKERKKKTELYDMRLDPNRTKLSVPWAIIDYCDLLAFLPSRPPLPPPPPPPAPAHPFHDVYNDMYAASRVVLNVEPNRPSIRPSTLHHHPPAHPPKLSLHQPTEYTVSIQSIHA